MSPEAARFLTKAQRLLGEARIMLAANLNEAAGRTAYLAGFHAAQAFLFETGGKIFKTHHGVQREFLRVTKDDLRFTAEQRVFLSQTFNLKSIADYETGPDSEISTERANKAIEAAKLFVKHVFELLAAASA